MARSFQDSMLTANHLFTGEVVYYDMRGKWVDNIDDAQIFLDQAHAQSALDAISESEVVGAYLAPISLLASGHAPAHFREEFRAKGPSNYPHGKQANV